MLLSCFTLRGHYALFSELRAWRSPHKSFTSAAIMACRASIPAVRQNRPKQWLGNDQLFRPTRNGAGGRLISLGFRQGSSVGFSAQLQQRRVNA